ncbi:hypothetical protein L249_8829, partial [Ophiocordyceps polyrhachis-furcata BCC 54312]
MMKRQRALCCCQTFVSQMMYLVDLFRDSRVTPHDEDAERERGK